MHVRTFLELPPTEPDSGTPASSHSRKSMLSKLLPLHSICQHQSSKILSEDSEPQKLKDSKPRAKIPGIWHRKKIETEALDPLWNQASRTALVLFLQGLWVYSKVKLLVGVQTGDVKDNEDSNGANKRS